MKNTPIPFEEIRNVVIIRRNGLGDVLSAIPLVLRCKELMPKAKITLCIEESNLPLIPHLVGPDEVILIPKWGNKYLEMGYIAWKLRKRKIDLAISAKTAPMKLMNRTLYALRAKYRIAYMSKKSRLVNCPRFIEAKTPIHQALKTIHLIDPCCKILKSSYFPQFKGVERKALFPLLTILVSVSNNRVGSTLSIDRYAKILNDLAKNSPIAVALSCLPKDRSRAVEMSAQLHMPHQIFATEDMGKFLVILNSSDAIFAADGGIIHLASALKKPIVALYGGTKVWEWGPLNEMASVLFHDGHVDEIDSQQILFSLQTMVQKNPAKPFFANLDL